MIDARDDVSRNLTKLAPLRFMTLDVIAIGLARNGPKNAHPRATYGGVMEIPQGLKYSKEHEWVATEDSVATIGITDHAQDQLGEIVYIELPAVGDKVSKDDPFGVVESVKAVSDIPVGVGLGVRSREQAAQIAGYADGVIVGSALVSALGDGLSTMRALTEELAAGVRQRNSTS